MNRCQDILANDTLVEHDSILIVVTLPRHVCHKQVTTQCELTILSGITLCKDVTLLHSLTLVTDRTQVDSHILVGTTELRDTILLQSWLKAYELLLVSTIVEDTDGCGINILYNTVALSGNHCT